VLAAEAELTKLTEHLQRAEHRAPENRSKVLRPPQPQKGRRTGRVLVQGRFAHGKMDTLIDAAASSTSSKSALNLFSPCTAPHARARTTIYVSEPFVARAAVARHLRLDGGFKPNTADIANISAHFGIDRLTFLGISCSGEEKDGKERHCGLGFHRSLPPRMAAQTDRSTLDKLCRKTIQHNQERA
jgi:hypothetical protein